MSHYGAMAFERETIGRRFEGRDNGLNALRLALATAVVVWHANLLPASSIELPWPVWQLLEEVPVDGFFAISGFLIVRSWHRRPDVRSFAAARALRLMPGLWACLTVTAFVIVPLSTWLAGVEGPTLGGQLRYLFGNAGIHVEYWTIGNTLANSPAPAWNLSLWSLWWEASFYLAVVTLGALGLLRLRLVVGIAACLWAISAGLTASGLWNQMSGLFWWHALPRLGLMFCCGALLWMLRDRIPYSRVVAAAATALIVVGGFTPNYRLLAAPALAYLCLYVGIEAGRWRRLVIRNDLSYGVYVYGVPVQQALILIGFAGSWAALSVLSMLVVLPLAALSWFAVEKPAMRLRKRERPPALLEPVQAGARSPRRDMERMTGIEPA